MRFFFAAVLLLGSLALLSGSSTSSAQSTSASSSSGTSSTSWSWSEGSSSWIFPGSSTSSSWWWSSSSSSDYSTGGSFYNIPGIWHDAGHMKTPFARSCGGFTLQGAMRYIGGYFADHLNETGHHTEDTVVRHSNAVVDLQWPDTKVLTNKSLPSAVINASGPGSCAMNSGTGFSFVMLGNRQATPTSPPSSTVYGMSNGLHAKNMTLPFPVSRSCIATPILNEFTMTHHRDDEEEVEGGTRRLRRSSLPAPDAVIIGGMTGDGSSKKSVDKLWGYNMRYGEWNAYCSLPPEVPTLCDCVAVSVPFNSFIAVCNNCTTPQFSVYMINLECSVHHLGGQPMLRSPFGLDYMHSVLVGKFAAFVYRPFGWGPELVVSLYDRELGAWSPEMIPKNLVPPRVHGGFFSWLGRLQLAGGQEIPDAKTASRDADVQDKSLDEVLAARLAEQDKKMRRMKKRKAAAGVGGDDDDHDNPAFYQPAPPPPASSALSRRAQQLQRKSMMLGDPAPDDVIVVSAIQELSIVRVNQVTTLGGGYDGSTFIRGQKIEVECRDSVYLKLSSTPECLDVVRGTQPSQCTSRNVALLQVNDTVDRAFLCSAPGSCIVPAGGHHDRCPGMAPDAEFAQCSGGSGCCWHPGHGCYRYSTDAANGGNGRRLYYYLTSPQPLRVLAETTPSPGPATTSTLAPVTSASPTSNNNNRGNGSNTNGGSPAAAASFINTRTGKFIIITCAVVVGLAIVLAFISHYRKTTHLLSKGGDFDLHDFVSKRYDVIKELGRGGFGTVYLAVRKEDKMELALKVIACNSEDDVQAALSEFSLLRQVKSHPGMMPIIDVHCSWEYDAEQKTMRKASSYGDLSPPSSPLTMESPLAASSTSLTGAAQGGKIQQQQFVCIVMEYFCEGDLAHYIAKTFERGGGPSETWLWTVLARQLFSVLAHLHNAVPPIWHRDLKPENVMMASSGSRLVMTDFGLAAEANRTFMSTRAGSFHYLAPECWSHRYTASVDIWSAGCILYAAATGCVAPPAARVMFNDARHPSFAQEIRDDLRSYSPDFANMVLSILKMDPLQRPDAQQLLDMVTAKCQDLNPGDEDCRSNSSMNASSVQLTQSSQSVSVNGEDGSPNASGLGYSAHSNKRYLRTAGDVGDDDE